MTDPRRPGGDAAAAGMLLVASIVLVAAMGLGLGTLFGAPEILTVIGGGIGLALGFRLVYHLYRDI